ncbi:uncharacterized protein BDZ99DRAFT_243450 [Mytilinidion resinicola]|uniref:Uncharacterized protein n=1 Tax=Mytilinidion resinicola TaxID=574789 RepID=A0A6A6YWR5_9PEZI|nr:uncharacterized protein BDZ99DRAFT_243450 [Mytilinidion resinicola]KAF2812843.1 hypothetical protein BDZ99DRAFT_243450 [Mytilinidion resinicola]
MDFRSRAQSPPNSASTTGTKRTRMFMPLSNHGMPRTPLPTSPGGSVRSHRFDKAEKSPGSPGSPPMSARTFATFFSSNGSEAAYSPKASSYYTASSPKGAYSPRAPYSPQAPYSPMSPSHFSGTTLGGSPAPTPSLPPIPQFERVQFEKVPLFDNIETVHAKRRSRGPASSVPTSPIAEPGTVRIDARIPELMEKETELEAPPNAIGPAADPAITQEDQPASKGALTKFSRRVRAVFGSKPEKKAEAKRRSKEAAQRDLERAEDVHWTEL